MGSFGNAVSNEDATSADKENCFRKLIRQRLMGSQDCFIKHRVLGRYYVAAMLFIVVPIYMWSYMNINLNIIYFEYDSSPFHLALRNSTETERNVIYYRYFVMEICLQIPAALLIYTISNHKFLTVAVALSSIIHMLIPSAVDHGSLLVAIFAQKLFLAPIRIAVLSMWKDWAPPEERKKFVILSLFFWILQNPMYHIFMWFQDAFMTEASFYALGVFGLAWSFLWFFTVSDTPANDSRDLHKKQICSQNNTLTIFKGMPKLSEVPWKSIITSMPVFTLFLLYFKIGSSIHLLDPLSDLMLPRIAERIGIHPGLYGLLYVFLYTVVFIMSALITDFLSRKYPGMIKTRKMIIFGALIIHVILLFGTLIHNLTVVVVSLWMSVIVLSTSFAGIFTNALDLSSQYVSIIGGFIETSFLLGMLLSYHLIDNHEYFSEIFQLTNDGGIVPYYEIGFTIVVAVAFYIWGSLEEQPWSLNNSSGQEIASSQSHPMQEEHELRAAVPLYT